MAPSWSVTGESYKVVQESVARLPAGVYTHIVDSYGGITAKRTEGRHDEMLDLPGLPTRYILERIKRFWDKKKQFEKFGFLQKCGIMLYGPPGCGKTSVTNLLRKQIVDLDGVVFLATGGFSVLTNGIDEFRKVEPQRPIMTLVEDLESYLEGSAGVVSGGSQERQALALYDGERQVNNIIHVATTNKPELLSDRFIRRPGRFDVVVGLFAPTEETRRAYLKSICNGHLAEKDLKRMVSMTEGLSLAYLRELASSYLVLEIPLEETIPRLREIEKKKYNSKGRTGFAIGFTEKE